jgi:hypothetical protein
MEASGHAATEGRMYARNLLLSDIIVSLLEKCGVHATLLLIADSRSKPALLMYGNLPLLASSCFGLRMREQPAKGIHCWRVGKINFKNRREKTSV